MEKDLTLEDIGTGDLEGVVVAGRSLGDNENYITSEEIYGSLIDSEVMGNWGKCVWSQCDYSRK